MTAVRGTTRNDLLAGTAFADFIEGLAGNDDLRGLGGNDLIRGGPGNDRIDGGSGNDTASYVDALGAVTVDLARTTAQDTRGGGVDTLRSIENLTGSSRSDTLYGDGAANRIRAGDGNDVIEGRGGRDRLQGQGGADTIRGGLGDDILIGGTGRDRASYLDIGNGVSVDLALRGPQATGAGSDWLIGIEGLSGSNHADRLRGDGAANELRGFGGNDRLEGRSGTDTLTGDYGDDRLLGGRGADLVDGGHGDDRLEGGDGDDVLRGRLGTDVLFGGAGIDTADYSGDDGYYGVDVDLRILDAQDVRYEVDRDTLSSIENLIGSGSGDYLYGDDGANRLDGRDGFDRLEGAGGNDVLLGAAGDDRLAGGAGNDRIDGGAGSDNAEFATSLLSGDVGLALDGAVLVVTSPEGVDRVTGVETFRFGDYFETYPLEVIRALAASAPGTIGTAGEDTITGGAGDDFILAGAGNDRLDGAAGNDVIRGGTGNDRIVGGSGIDTADYSDAGVDYEGSPPDLRYIGVTLDLDRTGAQDTRPGNLAPDAGSDMLVGIENLTGSGAIDELSGNAGSNRLRGGDGDDVLEGDGGADRLEGEAGSDDLAGGAGTDRLLGGDGDDRLSGGGGDDRLEGGAGFDVARIDQALSELTVTVAGDAVNVHGPDGTDSITEVEAFDFDGLQLNLAQLRLVLGAAAIRQGTDGTDSLLGTAASEVLLGGEGADVLQGGGGTDAIDGGDGPLTIVQLYVWPEWYDLTIDVASYEAASAGVWVDLGLQGAFQETGGAGRDLLEGIEALRGSAFADTLIAQQYTASIEGGAGNDVLVSGLYGDTFRGGSGADRFVWNSLEDGAPLLYTPTPGAASGYFDLDPFNSHDRILDFNANEDVLDLRPLDVTQADLRVYRNGATVVLTIGEREFAEDSDWYVAITVTAGTFDVSSDVLL